jgi:2-polyprenyl-6-methoxyphenol hydroxylase-like FAD-dependent oxidoreductase
VIRPDIAVVGGGLAGRLLAWRASRAGLDVALYDAASRLGEGAAAWAGAGNSGRITGICDCFDAMRLLLSGWEFVLSALMNPGSDRMDTGI